MKTSCGTWKLHQDKLQDYCGGTKKRFMEKKVCLNELTNESVKLPRSSRKLWPLKGTGTRDLILLKVVSLERSWWVGLREELKNFLKWCFIFLIIFFRKLSGTYWQKLCLLQMWIGLFLLIINPSANLHYPPAYCGLAYILS